MLNSKGKVLALLAVLLVILLVGGIYANFQAGSNAQANQGAIQQTVPPEVSASANSGVPQNPTFGQDVASGDGKETFELYCGNCHSPLYVTSLAPLPTAMWAAEVDKMRKTYSAAIPDDAAKKIIRYLSEHYTAQTLKR